MAREGEVRKKRDSARALPTGTVTFVFTDIEGSTQRWEQRRDPMKAAVARHDALMQMAIERHRGYVFKTVGDAFCAAFSTPQDAIAAALDAQQALVREGFAEVNGLPVRIGIHTGLADERNGDYFGPAVNRTARLMSIAHGGQVLLSGATRELVRSDLPIDATLIDLGSHRLKDLTQPEQVWQLTSDGLPSAFPPLRSLETQPNNLPMQVTSFLGREHDLEELKAHLAEHRLVTLFGAGGVGKTRMAVQVGADLLDRFPDGVWIADLAPINDPELATSVVAKALNMGQAVEHRLGESIPLWLKQKHLLLILDDCEHVIETAAALADAIHRNCPSVRILATSRQALGVSGEKVLRLASLAIPENRADLAPEVAITFGAVALFVDRAALVDRSFQLTDDNASVVAAICRHLDGIPLAIELAAARVKVLSLHNLARRLDERFTILTGGSRTALPRQKTLAALIDWSYDLLSPHEQRLFNRVAVFAGGFTLDAVTSVCACDGIDAPDVLDLIASLADKSLIVADTARTHERYRLLESTREYAMEKLKVSGERDLLARRHAEHFLGVAQQAEKDLGEMALGEWLASLEPSVDDFRAALEWALSKTNDAPLGGAVAGALEAFWWHGGAEAEGRRWIDSALGQIDESVHPDIAARLRRASALLTSRVLYS